MRYLSVCSGVEAASLAWNPLGWEAVAFSEIDKFPSAVLAHRFPSVQNLGDMTRYAEWKIESPDILVGGTPCQSFSVAGLRAGMADPRGNLALVFLGIADRFRPKWIVWENVPGVLSSRGGRDFGSFLGALEELGYGFAYRVLDAQYFGVPQRRRRVFVVGCLGDWRGSAAVLLERNSLQGHPPPRREAGESTAHPVAPSIGASGRGFSRTGETRGQDPVVAHSLRADGFDASEDGTGRGTPLVARTVLSHAGRLDTETETFITTDFDARQDPVGTRIREGMSVRRLTPRECERLQGMPDDWTLVPYRGKPASDGPRYKAIGNSMAVPVMRWIGERIAQVEAIQ